MEVRADQALYILGFSMPTLERSKEIYWLKSVEVSSRVYRGVSYWFKVINRVDFEGSEAEANLASLAWLTPRVLAHDAAVSALSKAGPFYPSRFGTLFSSHDAIAKLLDAESTTIENFLLSITGREEWGVKCIADRQVAIAKYAEKEGLNTSKTGASGKDYLKARQVQKSIDGQTRVWLSEITHSIQQMLEQSFGKVIVRPRISQPEGNEKEELVSSLAVLSIQTESESLGQWVTQWNLSQYPISGMRLELTGPWPPYSFCPSLTGTN